MFLKNYSMVIAVILAAFLLAAVSVQGEPGVKGKAETMKAPPPPDSSKWPMFLPAITSQAKGPVSYWSALTWVSCYPDAPLTFTVTIDGVSKKSVKKPTDLDGTREGWVITEPGEKAVAWKASGCGTYVWNGSMTQLMQPNMNYTFNLYPDQAGQPYVTVTAGSGNPIN